MFVIGLTGSLGTGKSTVAQLFARHGARVLDADEIAHRTIAPGGRCEKKVLSRFGREILTRGRIDRRKLAEIVFRDVRRLAELKEIIHPEVVRTIKKELARNRRTDRIVVLDVPLLFESGLNAQSDTIVVVKASRQIQLRRILKRGRMTKTEALRRIRAQMPISKKIRMADIVIDNRGSLNQTRKQVEEIWQRLSRRKPRT